MRDAGSVCVSYREAGRQSLDVFQGHVHSHNPQDELVLVLGGFLERKALVSPGRGRVRVLCQGNGAQQDSGKLSLPP